MKDKFNLIEYDSESDVFLDIDVISDVLISH